jgi:hypothetical protein
MDNRWLLGLGLGVSLMGLVGCDVNVTKCSSAEECNFDSNPWPFPSDSATPDAAPLDGGQLSDGAIKADSGPLDGSASDAGATDSSVAADSGASDAAVNPNAPLALSAFCDARSAHARAFVPS